MTIKKVLAERYCNKYRLSVVCTYNGHTEGTVYDDRTYFALSDAYFLCYLCLLQCCGSIYHQAKIVRKPLIPTVLWLLYGFLCLKKDVAVAGAVSISHRHGFADPDPEPYKNVTDSQHWYLIRKKYLETVSNGDEILLHLGEVDSLLLLLLPQL